MNYRRLTELKKYGYTQARSPVAVTLILMTMGLLMPVGFAGAASVADNINALSSFNRAAKYAANELLLEGPGILTEAHAALSSTASNQRLILQLITVLAEIADESSITPIIDAANRYPDNSTIAKNSFLALAKIPQSKKSIKFAMERLEKEEAPRQQRAAIWYFSAHKDNRARPWAIKNSQSTSDPAMRDAALFLLASLDDQSAKSKIAQRLMQVNRMDRQYNLLMALGMLAPPEEFRELTKQMDRKTPHYKSAHQMSEYRHANTAQRVVIAEKMLQSKFPSENKMALRFLVKTQNMQMISPQRKEHLPRNANIINAIRQSEKGELNSRGEFRLRRSKEK
ncbi:MAG: hypothetical protein KUG82_10375 [Pseudomonadales bacterium]|nr:hypothetical protein [Pseudomonadales bacterium]